MKKLVLLALTATAIGLAAPQLASATPLSLGSGLAAAADGISTTEVVRHRRWHRHHRHNRWHRRWNSRRW